MIQRFLSMAVGLLALSVLAACPAQKVSIAGPVVENGQVSLQASTPDPQGLPLFDRVDLLLLPADPGELPRLSPGSGEYFEAIRNMRGYYLGGDYLQDDERSSGEASYGIGLPSGGQLPAECSAWLACLRLEGTAVEIVQTIPLENWP